MQQAPLHPKLEHPTDDFLSEVLPDWLRRASAAQVMALRDAYKAHLRSQAEVSAVFRRLEPVDTFARRLLAEAFYQEQSVLLDLDSANWREQRRRFKVETGKLPTDESYFVKVPALQRLMQNFASGESFYMETALVYPPIPGTDVPERIALGDAAQIVSVCRRTDVGARYQEHLAQLFTPAFQQSLANSLRQALALQLEIAATRGLLPPAEAQIVRDVVAGRAGTLQNGRTVRCGPLQVLGCTLHAALVVELGSDDQRHAGSVLLVLSDDAHAALRHLVSWRVINFQLVEMFKDPARCAALVQRISLRERAGFLTTLAKRLADEDPDLEPTFANLPQGQFEGLALQQLERIREDARFLAVPTADADSRQALEREQSLASAGLALLNLAGLFVPAIGALLLADMVTHTLSEVYEGVRHWTLGHQHEALEHLLGVAENLAVTAAVAAGARWWRVALSGAPSSMGWSPSPTSRAVNGFGQMTCRVIRASGRARRSTNWTMVCTPMACGIGGTTVVSTGGCVPWVSMAPGACRTPRTRPRLVLLWSVTLKFPGNCLASGRLSGRGPRCCCNASGQPPRR